MNEFLLKLAKLFDELNKSEGMQAHMVINDIEILYANHTKELSKTIVLPDAYAGDLNTKRIKTYRRLADEVYSVDESVIRNIFNSGIDFYKESLTKK
jgi:hypothetical protein